MPSPIRQGTEKSVGSRRAMVDTVLSITAMALSAAMAEGRRVEEELSATKGSCGDRHTGQRPFPGHALRELVRHSLRCFSALESLETSRRKLRETGRVEPKSDLGSPSRALLSIDGLVIPSYRQ